MEFKYKPVGASGDYGWMIVYGDVNIVKVTTALQASKAVATLNGILETLKPKETNND